MTVFRRAVPYKFTEQQVSVLRQIKDRTGTSCDSLSEVIISRRIAMSVNVGTVDQYVRMVLGLTLVAFAFQDGLSIQGWHWAGLIGLVLLLTAFFRSCPIYNALGISTCTARQ
jgi:hypothetical protein